MGTIIIVLLILGAAVAAVGWSLYKTFSGKSNGCSCDSHCSHKSRDYTQSFAKSEEE